MGDNIDKLLDSYTVADADQALLDRIVAKAQAQPANENISAVVWMRRSAMLAATAVLGFWLGNVTHPAAKMTPAAITTAATAATTAQQDYLDRMIMGPGSLEEMGL
jgi:hypothetical protein